MHIRAINVKVNINENGFFVATAQISHAFWTQINMIASPISSVPYQSLKHIFWFVVTTLKNYLDHLFHSKLIKQTKHQIILFFYTWNAWLLDHNHIYLLFTSSSISLIVKFLLWTDSVVLKMDFRLIYNTGTSLILCFFLQLFLQSNGMASIITFM